MKEYKSFFSSIKNRKYNTWCKYVVRLDTYGCGCSHDCKYCYSKSLLNFRNLWDIKNVRVSYITEIIKKISEIDKSQIIKLGGMTDCFQPIEKKEMVTYNTIKLLNKYKINYIIVTKSDLVSSDKYIKIYDKNLAHFQITITNTNDKKCLEYENASLISKRIESIEKLYKMGFDVSLRLSPFIEEFIDFGIINNICCNKILIEFLKVNSWVKKWFKINYDCYTLKYGGYEHLPLSEKIRLVNKIKNFKQVSIGEYVKEHHKYFSKNVNYNSNDCCNIDIRKIYNNDSKQIELSL